jgi:mannosyl-oligosaccharide alpha-1,2-mannosidase
LDRAALAIENFNKHLSSTVGFGGIEDVNDPNSPKIDDTESFWFAETLKYLLVLLDTSPSMLLIICQVLDIR